MTIAIGITTTPPREHIFKQCLAIWKTNLPHNATIHTYCDTDFKGVSFAKNKVLSMCDYADHLFMVDDDIFPTVNGWYLPYTESGLIHACWNYNRALMGSVYNYKNVPDHLIYEKPNGCMLYATRKAIETVGGWDTDFKGYGYEHVNWSDRIFNAGLTPARYIDIPNSKGLFEMADCESSFTSSDRALIPANYVLYQEKYYSKEFKPFK